MIDWYRLLTDLQRCGLDLRAAARQAKVRYWPIYRVWRQDHRSIDLVHAEGEALLDLWADTTHRDRADAPKLHPTKSV